MGYITFTGCFSGLAPASEETMFPGLMLFLRSLFWTVLLPGTIAGYLPYWMLSRRGVFLPHGWGLAQFAGFLLIVPGVTGLLKCIWYFAVVGRGTLSVVDAPQRLVVTGLYRYVRNPMYVSVLTILLGETVFFESRTLLQYALGWLVVVHLFVVFHEEPTLRRRFGESYNDYCDLVRRWLPGTPSDPSR